MLTASQIAQELGATPGQIYRAVEKQGIRARGKVGAVQFWSPDQLDEFRAAVELNNRAAPPHLRRPLVDRRQTVSGFAS